MSKLKPKMDKAKKRRVWAWLLMWFIMPFTAFAQLEKLFSDDEDATDLDDDPNLGRDVKAPDSSNI